MENQTENQNPNPPVSPISQTLPVNPVSSPINPPAGGLKSKLPILIIGIILFLLITGSAAGFYIFKQQSFKTASKPTPVVQKQLPTPPLAGGPTANWKTYTNIKHGFTVRYPDDILIDANEVCPNKIEMLSLYIKKSYKEMKENPGLFCTVAYPELVIGIIIPEKPQEKSDEYWNITKEKTSLGSIIVEKYTSIRTGKIREATSTPFTKEVRIDINNNGYKFSIFYGMPFSISEELIDQILSTFKFTDSQTVDTSNWKTYQGNGFIFKYPSGLFLKENEKDFFVLLKTSNTPGNLAEISIDARLTGIFSEYNSAIDNVKKGLTDVSTKDFSNGIVIKGKMGSGMGEGTSTITGLIKYKTGAIAIENSTNPLQEELLSQIFSTFKFTQ